MIRNETNWAASTRRTRFDARAVTLIEILVVIAIIAILIAAVGLVGSAVKDRGNDRVTRQTMETLISAIDAYKEKKGSYPTPPNHPDRSAIGDHGNPPQSTPAIPYEPSALPGEDSFCARTRDGNYGKSVSLYDGLGETVNQLEYYLGHDPGGANPDYFVWKVNPSQSTPIPVLAPDFSFTSGEGLYLFLASVPDARTLLQKLPPSSVARRTALRSIGGYPVGYNGSFLEPLQPMDAWKNPIRYRGYVYRNNVRPFLWSAGPDGKFAKDPNRASDEADGKDDIFSDKAD